MIEMNMVYIRVIEILLNGLSIQLPLEEIDDVFDEDDDD